MDKNKVTIIAFCLLGLVFLDLSAIFWEKEYKRKYDEPVKNQILNIQTSYTGTASGATGATGPMAPSPSPEA